MSASDRNIFGNHAKDDALSPGEMLKNMQAMSLPEAIQKGLIGPMLLQAMKDAGIEGEHVGLLKINVNMAGAELPSPKEIEKLLTRLMGGHAAEGAPAKTPEEALANFEQAVKKALEETLESLSKMAGQNQFLPIRPMLGGGFCPN